MYDAATPGMVAIRALSGIGKQNYELWLALCLQIQIGIVTSMKQKFPMPKNASICLYHEITMPASMEKKEYIIDVLTKVAFLTNS